MATLTTMSEALPADVAGSDQQRRLMQRPATDGRAAPDRATTVRCMQLREATRRDVPSVVALLAQDQLGHHRETPSVPLPDSYWGAFDAIDDDPNNRLIVAEDQGVIVGTLQLTFIPYLTFRGSWRAQIEAVRVESTRRDQGVGRQLIEWAIDQARNRGCHLVQLTTNKARKDAHRFYESLGFEPSHEGMKLYLEGDVTGS